jgi:uncharacterized damage-inducible protein DinB
MEMAASSLMSVYEGWDSHQLALVRTVAPLTAEQLAWRPTPQHGSVGELIGHLALARLFWFHKMGAPGSAELARQVAPWAGERIDTEDPAALQRWSDALEALEIAISQGRDELGGWLEATWRMIETTLTTWTVADLAQTYRHLRRGQMQAISRQWTIWRVMSHDLHHGGQLALLLGLQGIAAPYLGDLGGHLTEPPPADPA